MSAAMDVSQSPWRDPLGSRDLAKGLWPQSLLFWLIFGWFALYIIRPWEVLFPWLSVIRIERTYCLLALVAIAASGRLRFDLSRQSIALVMLLSAMLLSAFTGIAFHRSLQGIYGVLVHVAMYIAMLSVIRRPRDLLCIATMYLVIMAMYLGKSQWEYFIHGRHEYTQGVPRLVGIDLTYRHYNSVAASALLTLPFLQLLWSLRADIGRAYSAAGRKRLNLALIGFGFFAVTSVLLTNSRGGMLGLIVFFVLACVTGKTAMRALRTLCTAGLIAASIAVFALPQTQRERLNTLWHGSANSSAQGSIELRKQAFRDGIKMFLENPITGVGLGNFKRYRAQRGDLSGIEAHNVYVHVLGETGLVGGVAFAMFVGCILRNFRRINRLVSTSLTSEAEFLKNLALAGRNSLLLLMYFGLLGSNLDRFNWFWLAGIGVAGVTMARRSVAMAAEEMDLAPEFQGSERINTDAVHSK